MITLSISLLSTSLSYADNNKLTEEQMNKIDKIIRDLGAQGKLSYPLRPEIEQRLKQELSKDEYELLIFGVKLHVPIYPIEIEGKILDKDDNLFTDEATLTISVYHEHTEKIKGGHFRYDDLPKARGVGIEVSKEGYYGDRTGVGISFEKGTGKIIVKDIILHLIEKGDPVDLEWTEDAEIEYYPEEQEPYGWSFKRRWQFPADNYDVLMVLRVNEDGDLELSMKEGGGFIPAKRYKHFESQPDEKAFTKFEWMPYAPELGYEQTITPGGYFYFRTPDGKYGKMRFKAYNIYTDSTGKEKAFVRFTYYLNPTGGRNLELKERIRKHPWDPKSREWWED